MLIEVIDSRQADCPIIYYESDVIPSPGDSVSMNKTKQYPGFAGIVLDVLHEIYEQSPGGYPKARCIVVLEMSE